MIRLVSDDEIDTFRSVVVQKESLEMHQPVFLLLLSGWHHEPVLWLFESAGDQGLNCQNFYDYDYDVCDDGDDDYVVVAAVECWCHAVDVEAMMLWPDQGSEQQ